MSSIFQQFRPKGTKDLLEGFEFRVVLRFRKLTSKIPFVGKIQKFDFFSLKNRTSSFQNVLFHTAVQSLP